MRYDLGRIAGVILAGGEGSRLAGGKPFRSLLGRPLIGHVIEKVSPQVERLWLSARGNADRLIVLGLPIVEDPVALRGSGPLAGIVSALETAVAEGFGALAVFPCDVPFLPNGLVASLASRLENGREPGAIVSLSGCLQPTIGLWRADAFNALKGELNAGRRTLRTVCSALGTAVVDGAEVGLDWTALFNVNTEADLLAAELLGRGQQ